MTNLNQNALNLLKQRYFQVGENWEALVDRVTDNVCGDAVGEDKEIVRNFILNRVFLPASPVLVNAGTAVGGLFPCAVRYPEADTLLASFEALTDMALLAQKGYGIGFTSSLLRPKGSSVAGSAHGVAYGANLYAKWVSYLMSGLTQGNFRRVALMYNLACEHLEADEFVYLKQSENESDLANFNQSLVITNTWMRKALGSINSNEQKLFDKICQHAWNNGEPGAIFYDNVNDPSPYKITGQELICCNPCSEQSLPNFGQCCLGSINLNHEYFNNGNFDFQRLAEVTELVTKFLDDTGTANKFPTERFKTWYDENRPIGIGIMGLADLFLRYGITYGSDESIELTKEIMRVIQKQSYITSEDLGYRLGIPKQCAKLPVPRRNITTVSIAPTGSIAMIAECSHGIEPIFSPRFTRIDERGEEYVYEHPLANESYFVSAVGSNQATWKQQIDLVAAAQMNCDSGVSKTINLSNSATVEDVKSAFIYAWQKKIKGITVYRDGSRQFQVLNQIPTEDEVKDAECLDGVCTL